MKDATVMFVCEHGAYRSRLAAAYFNRVSQPGWRATSAGREPQDAISEHAVRQVRGTDVADLLDVGPPRPLDALPCARLVVAIDCDVPGAVAWHLDCHQVGEPMRDELRARAERLAAELTHGDS